MSEKNARPVKVLFVCLGNICRSPTAEGIFRDLLRQRGLTGRILHDSCGTGGWHHGEPPDPRAQNEARRRGIDISDLRGRQIARTDFSAFDYIIAMDDDNHGDLRRLCPPEQADRVYRAVSFAPQMGASEVPDPYYGGAHGFGQVYELLTAVCEGLLERIQDDHGAE
jgi:protein-tyrosine phosphatase